MKRINLYISGVLVAGMLLSGCMGTKELQGISSHPLPGSYASSKDTANVANIKWRDYFNDPDLASLIDTALQHNLDLLITGQETEIARANARMAKGLLFPSINAFAGVSQQKFGDYTMNAAGNKGTVIYQNETVPVHLRDYNVGLQCSWEVDFMGKLRNSKKAAVARYLSSVEGKNWVVTNLVAQIANDYYTLLALDNEHDIIQQSISLQDSALQVVTVQKQAGVVTEMAVSQFEAQLLNSKKLEVDVNQQITEMENEINYLLGRYPQPIKRNKNAFNTLAPAAIKAGVPSDLLNNRPDIRQAQYNLVAAKANVKAAHAAFFPNFTISGTLGYDAYKPSLTFMPQSIAYNVLGELTAPLINRSIIKAQFKTAKATQIEALYNYQKSILNGYVEVDNMMAHLQNNQQILDLKAHEVNKLSDAISASNFLFRTGRASYLEVLTMQENLLQSQLERVDAMKQHYASIVGIYQALGGGWK
jgi:NodT family efflux transporter outer membrane factor (OMF) lipoprotein